MLLENVMNEQNGDLLKLKSGLFPFKTFLYTFKTVYGVSKHQTISCFDFTNWKILFDMILASFSEMTIIKMSSVLGRR